MNLEPSIPAYKGFNQDMTFGDMIDGITIEPNTAYQLTGGKVVSC